MSYIVYVFPLSIMALLFVGAKLQGEKIKVFNFELILCIFYILTIPYVGFNMQSFILLCSLFFLNVIMKFRITDENILRFVNSTYLIYLFLSLLLYFEIIPITAIGIDKLNIFAVSLGEFNTRTLIGLDGTTSTLDSYSLLVFLLNVGLGKQKISFISIVSLLATLATFTTTPLLSLIVTILYVLVPIKIKKPAFLIVSFVCFISFLIPSVFKSYDFYAATNGRSYIWEIYYKVLESGSISDILFGFRNVPEVTLFWAKTANPHSTFLDLIFKFGLLFYVLFLGYLLIKTMKMHDFSNKSYLVLAIFVFGTANGYILSLGIGNLIYLITIYYLISRRPEIDEKFESSVPVKKRYKKRFKKYKIVW